MESVKGSSNLYMELRRQRAASGQRASIGGIQKRRSSGRVDREGDLDMGVQVPTGPRARPVNGAKSRPVKPNTVPGKKSESGPAKGLRPARSARAPVGTVRGLQPTGGFIEMRVTGWKKSTSNETETVIFLERKVKEKFRRVKTVGDYILFQVPLVKVPALLEWNNVAFANSHLQIQAVNELPASLQSAVKPDMDRSEEAKQTAVILRNFLNARYRADIKMLDLSNLPGDPELIKMGFFSQASTANKMFPALMKVADEQFTTNVEKREQILSVTLEGNGVADLSLVVSLAATFPDLKNLSLENNQIDSWKKLEPWKFKFRKLEQLVLTGNPITQVPGYREQARKWWRTLIMLDNITYPEPPIAANDSKNAGPGPFPLMPLQVKASGIVDDAEHTNEFLSTYFQMYDRDRKACLQAFYNSTSVFAVSVNVSAPRLIGDTKHNIQKWDLYIPKSRNLTRLRTATAAKDRSCKGLDNIWRTWQTLPQTLHDVNDPTKWSYDSRNLPFGDTVCMLMTIHGEYEEPENIAKEGIASKRSFTRTFIVVPKGPEGGYLVAKDILMVRAYGGSHAWGSSAQDLIPAAVQPQQLNPIVPQGEPNIQRQMIIQLMNNTGLTEQYAQLCLEQTGWEFDKAMQAFNEVRASGQLPPDALSQAALA